MTKTKENKTRTFHVPKGYLSLFFDRLEDNSMEYELIEVDEDGELCVQVEYSSTERDVVMDLVELEDQFHEGESEEEEED